MNLSLATAILDENLKGPTATFDEMGLNAVRWAWETVKAALPTPEPVAVTGGGREESSSFAESAELRKVAEEHSARDVPAYGAEVARFTPATVLALLSELEAVKGENERQRHEIAALNEKLK